jgi:hypothetical protein
VAFNVFVDHPVTGDSVEVFNTYRAYDASALANAFTDAGYRVATDLWGATVADAMVSPAVWTRYGLDRYPALRTGTYRVV